MRASNAAGVATGVFVAACTGAPRNCAARRGTMQVAPSSKRSSGANTAGSVNQQSAKSSMP